MFNDTIQKLTDCNQTLICHWINEYMKNHVKIVTLTNSTMYTDIFSKSKTFEIFASHSKINDNKWANVEDGVIVSSIPIDDFSTEIIKIKKYLELTFNEYWKGSVESNLAKKLINIVKSNSSEFFWNGKINLSGKNLEEFIKLATFIQNLDDKNIFLN